MAEAKTTIRRDVIPTVLIVGVRQPPDYVTALLKDGYEVVAARDADEARAAMGLVMPHVVLMSRCVPMADHRFVYDSAQAVGAPVVLTPDDAHSDLVGSEVEIAVQKARRRREKVALAD